MRAVDTNKKEHSTKQIGDPRPTAPENHDATSSQSLGTTFTRKFTEEGQNVWDTTSWTKRNAVISNENGEIFFKQEDIDVPEPWSQLATNVVASKYFRGHLGSENRESSIRSLIHRVSQTIANWGLKSGYFVRQNDADIFYDELTYLLLHQFLSFNSPVWFNVGVEKHPQCSACFINSVEDSMDSIMELAKTEARLFQGGSGTGSNLSPIRGSREKLTGGGMASGPVSFMRGYDAFAGVIKSGGKTRRAAKMVILNIDHPDIQEFIRCKAREEEKAWSLIDAGYDGSVNGDAYNSVFFQNANHSIRVTDDFMNAVLSNKDYELKSVRTSDVTDTVSARDLLWKAAEAAHVCGDPGIQYDTEINNWHTCSATAPIHASNPCSEYMFLDDSACNLASLNLRKFYSEDSGFDTEKFCQAVELSIVAQEIIVEHSSYPTPKITQNSHDYRPLGLGYANLGALLMSMGLPYDSESGRNMAASITSLMCGHAYFTSAKLAKSRSAFPGFEKNRSSFMNVINKHFEHARKITGDNIATTIATAATDSWSKAIETGEEFGFRNAQVTVLAPTGTIAFMMDCDTTGIEPDIALVKYKRLVGGGTLKIVNHTVPLALRKLGYSETDNANIVEYIDQNGTIEGAPSLKTEHLNVFDCAFRAAQGTRAISPMGHVEMMSAVQPFLSGAISKTVNMPEESTVEDIFNIFVKGWQKKLKALAIYRDNCKRAQPLSTKSDSDKNSTMKQKTEFPARRQLPAERPSLTHKFAVGGHEGYITVGMFTDGYPGEIFITMSKEGSTIRGLMDTIATSISLALQYGVPLSVLVDKFSHMRFEPSGFTGNKDIPIAKSIVDYIFRWLALKFLDENDSEIDSSLSSKAETLLKSVLATPEDQMSLPISRSSVEPTEQEKIEKKVFNSQADSPPCHVCGSITVRSGSCYSCPNCGTTSGCS